MKDQTTINEWLAHVGIKQLNDMQKASIEAYDKHDDIVLLSPTGSGKTLAYLLPLAKHLQRGVEAVQAIVLVPSRELAMQIDGVFKQLKTGFNSMSCYGGRPASEEHRGMKNLSPSVIFGTPGRILDHLEKGNISAGSVHTLILDEFDKCLELGFQEEMTKILSCFPDIRKRVLLSATDAEQIPAFVGVKGKQVKRLDFLEKTENSASTRIGLYEVDSPDKDKLTTLYRLLCCMGAQSSIVFLNYRDAVERVSAFLREKNIACECFHGKLEQEEREKALYKFSNGSCNVLIATDLAARGLDIPDIDNVIHYHFPLDEDAFIHRNGRTARWESTGRSFIIKGPEEILPPYMTEKNIEDYAFPTNIPEPAKPEWETLYIGKGKKDKLNKVDILGFLCKKGHLTAREVGRIDVRDYYSFVAIKRKRLKEMLNLVRDEKIKGKKTKIEVAL